jgi:hypothetical protein
LRDTVQLALHSSGEGGQPLVVHHKGLDFVLGERGVIWRRVWLPSKTPVRCKDGDWRVIGAEKIVHAGRVALGITLNHRGLRVHRGLGG